MSRWTHPTCEPCFVARYPGRQPLRLREPQDEHCCYCGARTLAGIYTRHDPSQLPCDGQHEATNA